VCSGRDTEQAPQLDKPESAFESSIVSGHWRKRAVTNNRFVGAIQVIAQSFAHDFAAPKIGTERVHNHR
jgi:hypothetical protein